MTAKTGPHWEWIVLAAAGSMLITMGARQSIGLFVAPLDLATGLGLAKISLSLAIGQFMWGFAQPIAGAVADRYGPGRMIGIGLVMLVTGNILTIEAQDASCTDSISWMVVGERKDKHMMETDWTDDNGRVIVEPLKPVVTEAA